MFKSPGANFVLQGITNALGIVIYGAERFFANQNWMTIFGVVMALVVISTVIKFIWWRR